MSEILYKNKGVTAITTLPQIRRNLLVSSCILICLLYYNLPIKKVSFLISIEETDKLEINTIINTIILIITIYYFLNFISHIISEIKQNRIDSTGVEENMLTRISMNPTYQGSSIERVTLDCVKNSTLALWFEYAIYRQFSSVEDYLSRLNKIITYYEDNMTQEKFNIEKLESFENDLQYMKNIQNILKEKSQTAIKDILNDKRWISLDNFDNYFKSLIKWDNFRAILFDYLIPIITGLLSFYLYIRSIKSELYSSLAFIITFIVLFIITEFAISSLENN